MLGAFSSLFPLMSTTASSNAAEPIFSSDSGNSTEETLHPLNAELPILFNPFPNLILLTPMQLANAA